MPERGGLTLEEMGITEDGAKPKAPELAVAEKPVEALTEEQIKGLEEIKKEFSSSRPYFRGIKNTIEKYNIPQGEAEKVIIPAIVDSINGIRGGDFEWELRGSADFDSLGLSEFAKNEIKIKVSGKLTEGYAKMLAGKATWMRARDIPEIVKGLKGNWLTKDILLQIGEQAAWNCEENGNLAGILHLTKAKIVPDEVFQREKTQALVVESLSGEDGNKYAHDDREIVQNLVKFLPSSLLENPVIKRGLQSKLEGTVTRNSNLETLQKLKEELHLTDEEFYSAIVSGEVSRSIVASKPRSGMSFGRSQNQPKVLDWDSYEIPSTFFETEAFKESAKKAVIRLLGEESSDRLLFLAIEGMPQLQEALDDPKVQEVSQKHFIDTASNGSVDVYSLSELHKKLKLTDEFISSQKTQKALGEKAEVLTESASHYAGTLVSLCKEFSLDTKILDSDEVRNNISEWMKKQVESTGSNIGWAISAVDVAKNIHSFENEKLEELFRSDEMREIALNAFKQIVEGKFRTVNHEDFSDTIGFAIDFAKELQIDPEKASEVVQIAVFGKMAQGIVDSGYDMAERFGVKEETIRELAVDAVKWRMANMVGHIGASDFILKGIDDLQSRLGADQAMMTQMAEEVMLENLKPRKVELVASLKEKFGIQDDFFKGENVQAALMESLNSYISGYGKSKELNQFLKLVPVDKELIDEVVTNIVLREYSESYRSDREWSRAEDFISEFNLPQESIDRIVIAAIGSGTFDEGYYGLHNINKFYKDKDRLGEIKKAGCRQMFLDGESCRFERFRLQGEIDFTYGEKQDLAMERAKILLEADHQSIQQMHNIFLLVDEYDLKELFANNEEIKGLYVSALNEVLDKMAIDNADGRYSLVFLESLKFYDLGSEFYSSERVGSAVRTFAKQLIAGSGISVAKEKFLTGYSELVQETGLAVNVDEMADELLMEAFEERSGEAKKKIQESTLNGMLFHGLEKREPYLSVVEMSAESLDKATSLFQIIENRNRDRLNYSYFVLVDRLASRNGSFDFVKRLKAKGFDRFDDNLERLDSIIISGRDKEYSAIFEESSAADLDFFFRNSDKIFSFKPEIINTVYRRLGPNSSTFCMEELLSRGENMDLGTEFEALLSDFEMVSMAKTAYIPERLESFKRIGAGEIGRGIAEIVEDKATYARMIFDITCFNQRLETNKLNLIVKTVRENASEDDLEQIFETLRWLPDEAVVAEDNIESLRKKYKEAMDGIDFTFIKTFPNAEKLLDGSSNVHFLGEKLHEIVQELGLPYRRASVDGVVLELPNDFIVQFNRERRNNPGVIFVPELIKFIVNKAVKDSTAFTIEDSLLSQISSSNDRYGRRESYSVENLLGAMEDNLDSSLLTWQEAIGYQGETPDTPLFLIANERTGPADVAAEYLPESFAKEHGIKQDTDFDEFFREFAKYEELIDTLYDRALAGEDVADEIPEELKQITAGKDKIIPIYRLKVPSSLSNASYEEPEGVERLVTFLKLTKLLGGKSLFMDESTRSAPRSIECLYNVVNRREESLGGAKIRLFGKINGVKGQSGTYLEETGQEGGIEIGFIDPWRSEDKPINDDSIGFVPEVTGKGIIEVVTESYPTVTPYGVSTIQDLWKKLIANEVSVRYEGSKRSKGEKTHKGDFRTVPEEIEKIVQ